MKKILQVRIEELFAEASPDSLKHLIGEVQGNLNKIQEDVIKYRIRMWFIGGLFALLTLKFISLNNFPGFSEVKVSEELKALLPNIGDIDYIIIYLLPFFFAINYYFFILSLVYRSQLRFLHRNLYKQVFPDLYNQKMDLYTIPHSPGHIMKVLHRIGHRKRIEDENANGGIKLVRKAGVYFEMAFHWIFLVVSIYCLFLRFPQTDSFAVLIVVLLISVISIILFIYALGLAAQYNNYFGAFNGKITHFTAPHIVHTSQSAPPPHEYPDNSSS